MGHRRPREVKSNDIILLLPDAIQRTVGMVRALNASANEALETMNVITRGLEEFMNINIAIRRDEMGLAESWARLAATMERASIALQIQLMDNEQPNDSLATSLNPFPLETNNATLKLNAGVAQAMRLARLTRSFSTEILRMSTLLYREATKLQEVSPHMEQLSEEKKGAIIQTQPGYHVVKGTYDARIGGYRTERLPEIAERLVGSRANWQLIADFNNIKYPYELSIGQVLLIPNLLVRTEETIVGDANTRLQILRNNIKALIVTIDNITSKVFEDYPEYEQILVPEDNRPSRILYTRIDSLGTDWYLDSAYDPARGYSGRTHDLVVDERGQIAIRVGIDSFSLGMRRLLATQQGHVPLRREYGHLFEEIMGTAKNPRLQLVMARVAMIKALQQESDRIYKVHEIEVERNFDNIYVRSAMVPKGFINNFLITIPIPELGGAGKVYVNMPIPLPHPDQIRD